MTFGNTARWTPVLREIDSLHEMGPRSRINFPSAKTFPIFDPVRKGPARLRYGSHSNKISHKLKRRIANGRQRARLEAWESNHMLWYAWVFLAVALLAAILGFGGIAAAAAGIAKICFVIFLVLFLISLVAGRRVAP